MRTPRLGVSMDGNLDGHLRRLLTDATVQDRLTLVEMGVATLVDRRPCTLNLHEGTVTVDLVQARALAWRFLNDHSLQVRRRLAHRLATLEWEQRFPFVASLVWDSDDRVRRLAENSLGEVEPVLASVERRLGAEPFVLGSLVLENLPDPGAGFSLGGKPSLSPGGPPPPPAGAANVVREEPPAGEEVIRRYTDCDFTPDPQPPASGRVSFALRIEPTGSDSRPVDLRVPAGKPFATVLVHAFSQQFSVSPEVWFVKVPRAMDSEVAEFTVRTETPGEGEVGLLVYDEFRLIGSLSVRLRATETPQGLRLEKLGAVIFRDPAPTLPAKSNGITVQLSLTGADSRVAFHLLVPLGEGSDWHPTLYPLGRSGDALEAQDIQAALAALRATVDEIQQGLDNPTALGASDAGEALQAIRLHLEGAGRQIAEEILSPSARTVLARLRPGAVVHLVIRDAKLDALPWELAWNAETGRHFNQDLVLVRVPVRDNSEYDGEAAGLSSRPALPPAPDRFLYLLGEGVAPAAAYPQLKKVVRSVGGYEVVTNFDQGVRESVSIVQLHQQIKKAKVIHLLCHGVVEEKQGLYLKLEDKVLGRLTPSLVRSLPLAPNAAVFVNSCSSAAATFSVTGLTTFGWSFLRAGARAYVGSLAPVTTHLALKFAEAFFTAHLDGNLPITHAMYEARRQFTGETDPTWLLYTLYGDLSGEAQPTL